MNISLSASALSRETGSAVPSRVSLLIFILRLNLVLAYGVPPEFRGGVHLFVYNRHTPSGHAVAYRWRSLLRVRRHGASKPQGSSERVLPWQVTMNQLIFASRSHTHYWYKVGMLKVPAEYLVLMFGWRIFGTKARNTTATKRNIHHILIGQRAQFCIYSSPN